LTAPLGSGLHQTHHHYYGGYTPFWYQKFLGDAGFINIQVESNGNFFKLYAQESLRFAMRSSPVQLKVGSIERFFWLFLWLPYAALTVLFVPILHALDGHDLAGDFTVGYHVLATRKAQ
jgi:hypothetical protein